MAHPCPSVVSRDEWLKARLELLALEKANTREYDRINALRRRLPMVRVEKDYRFSGEEGESTLRGLFGDHCQLIVYHFMFGPDAEAACPGCTGYIDALGDLSSLAERGVGMVMVSRGPLDRLLAYRRAKGWTLPWYSSLGSTFNADFGVTVGPGASETYNYKSGHELVDVVGEPTSPKEMPGTSVFFRSGDEVFHTYSTFARGGEALTDSYRLLDITAFGRQEDFEDSPPGWPQLPTYG
ncbi:MAG: DUF899 domain-containing protein [Fimbriimonadaceae bacterium]